MDVMRELHAVFENTSPEAAANAGRRGADPEPGKDGGKLRKNIIKHACEKYGSTRKVAKAIGISQTQLVRKKKKYEI